MMSSPLLSMGRHVRGLLAVPTEVLPFLAAAGQAAMLQRTR